MRKLSVAVFAVWTLLAQGAFAAGAYDGVYQYGLSPAYYSVHQNGNQLLIASMTFLSVNNDVDISVGPYIVNPASIGTWDYSVGTITGNKARVTGIGLFGSCSATTDITFESNGTAAAALVSYANTAFGTSEGVSCSSLFQSISTTIGTTVILRRIF